MGGWTAREPGTWGSLEEMRGTEAFTPACGASYAGQGGRSARSCGHSLDTGRVWCQCVSGNVLSVHRTEQTSTCILPMYTCRAFLLCVSFCVLSSENFLCTLCCIPHSRICVSSVSSACLEILQVMVSSQVAQWPTGDSLATMLVEGTQSPSEVVTCLLDSSPSSVVRAQVLF